MGLQGQLAESFDAAWGGGWQAAVRGEDDALSMRPFDAGVGNVLVAVAGTSAFQCQLSQEQRLGQMILILRFQLQKDDACMQPKQLEFYLVLADSESCWVDVVEGLPGLKDAGRESRPVKLVPDRFGLSGANCDVL